VRRLSTGIFLRALFRCSLLAAVVSSLAAQQMVDSRDTRFNSSRAAVKVQGATEIIRQSGYTAVSQPEALVPVFEQLTQMNSEHGRSPVHIVHFGDSHTASDDLTARIRDLLKEQFGDGGSGFSFAGHPFREYRRFDVRGGATGGWSPAGLRSPGRDGYYGLGGVSISTRSPGQSIFITTDCDRLEVHYLQQPGGGDVALFDSDKFLEKFSTAGDFAPGVIRYQTTPGTHRFLLKTLTSSPVSLFGWVADKESGITYEALGINGVEASIILRWDEKMFATYLNGRDPGLVVLAYGTNEAADGSWSRERYEMMFSRLLQMIRRAIPTASILVVGPPDSCSRSHGILHPVAGLDGIVKAQQNACRENGCAFWDLRQYMGGPGSMRDWVRAGLAEDDYIHLTRAGYQRVATALFTEIMRLYQQFTQIRLQISTSAADLQTGNR